jgi:hypothetical protein
MATTRAKKFGKRRCTAARVELERHDREGGAVRALAWLSPSTRTLDRSSARRAQVISE